MKIIAIQAFSWAHRGVEVQEFAKGEVIETEDEDLIAVATAEGWASKDGKPSKKKSGPAEPDAGENADSLSAEGE